MARGHGHFRGFRSPLGLGGQTYGAAFQAGPPGLLRRGASEHPRLSPAHRCPTGPPGVTPPGLGARPYKPSVVTTWFLL